MSNIKQYGATIADAGDGVMDAAKINELELERAWKEWEYEKLSNEIDNKTLEQLQQEISRISQHTEYNTKHIFFQDKRSKLLLHFNFIINLIGIKNLFLPK